MKKIILILLVSSCLSQLNARPDVRPDLNQDPKEMETEALRIENEVAGYRQVDEISPDKCFNSPTGYKKCCGDNTKKIETPKIAEISGKRMLGGDSFKCECLSANSKLVLDTNHEKRIMFYECLIK